jgi:hypothetical protein
MVTIATDIGTTNYHHAAAIRGDGTDTSARAAHQRTLSAFEAFDCNGASGIADAVCLGCYLCS